jgi:hypothetical protein
VNMAYDPMLSRISIMPFPYLFYPADQHDLHGNPSH